MKITKEEKARKARIEDLKRRIKYNKDQIEIFEEEIQELESWAVTDKP